MKKSALLLAAVILISVLCSCGAELTVMDFIPQNDNYKGFGGYEFIIKGNWPKNWDPYAEDEDNEVGHAALTVRQDALVAHNAEIMEEYDCKITSVYASWSWSEELLKDLVADTANYDLMDTNASLMVDNIKAGYVIPWEDTDIDLTDYAKFGAQGYLEASAYKGKHYGIWPEYFQACHSFRGVMGVNKKLLKSFTDVGVFELYENGKWTFEEFKKLLELVSTDAQMMPLTYYDSRMLVVCSMLSNGSNIVTLDESSGKYVFGPGTRKAVTALEYAKSLVDEGLAFPDEDYGQYFDVDLISPFYLTETWCIGGNLEDMDTICFPFGPDGEYGVDRSAYRSINERYFYMPISAYPEDVGRFADIWFEELDDYPQSVLIEDFKNENFYNDESFDLWMELASSAKYDYAFDLFDIYDGYMDAMASVITENGSIPEFVDSYGPKVQAVIDENLNN